MKKVFLSSIILAILIICSVIGVDAMIPPEHDAIRFSTVENLCEWLNDIDVDQLYEGESVPDSVEFSFRKNTPDIA